MAKARNQVIAGDYEGKLIITTYGLSEIPIKIFKSIKLNKDNVQSYEVITDEHTKSAASGIARGLIGGALLGPVGMLGGALSAKNKSIYQIAIEFKDGKKSLIEVDDTGYKAIIQHCFQ